MACIVPKTYQQMQRDYHALLSELANQWFTLQCRDICSAFYLVGTRGRCSHNTEIWQSVRVAREDDLLEGEQLITGVCFPRGATTEQARAFIQGLLSREPLYVFAD